MVIVKNIDLVDDKHVEGNDKKCQLNNCLICQSKADCLTNQDEGSDLKEIDLLK